VRADARAIKNILAQLSRLLTRLFDVPVGYRVGKFLKFLSPHICAYPVWPKNRSARLHGTLIKFQCRMISGSALTKELSTNRGMVGRTITRQPFGMRFVIGSAQGCPKRHDDKAIPSRRRGIWGSGATPHRTYLWSAIIGSGVG
jgi:hypothetical protein